MTIETIIRPAIFLFLILTFSTLEVFFSYRPRNLQRKFRWLGNLGMVGVSIVLLKVILPMGLIYFAEVATSHKIGLFHWLGLSGLLPVGLSLVLLDLAIYWQHRWSHKFHFLWRLHRVHHADVDLDASSALRFHPFEILLSTVYKIGLVFLLGVPATAVFLFEIILNSTALFNHANLFIPKPIEKVLRHFLVTPQMHIVHHSVEKKESDTNFGFSLPWWDFIFGSYSQDFQSAGVVGQSYNRSEEGTNF